MQMYITLSAQWRQYVYWADDLVGRRDFQQRFRVCVGEQDREASNVHWSSALLQSPGTWLRMCVSYNVSLFDLFCLSVCRFDLTRCLYGTIAPKTS